MSFTAADLLRWWSDEDVAGRFVPGEGDVDPATLRFESLTFDSRSSGPGFLFCGVAGEHTHGGNFAGDSIARGSEAVLLEGNADRDRPADLPAAAPSLWVVDGRGALAAAARGRLRELGATIVGITGSNGKTSTKDFTRAALSGRKVGASPGNLNSSYGLPAAVLAQPAGVDVLVLEMGASAPGEIARLVDIARPDVACVTNVSAAHLEFFGTVEDVAETKSALVAGLADDGTAVLNRDDPTYEYFRDRSAGARVLTFGHSEAADLRVGAVEVTRHGLRVVVDGIEAALPVFGAVNALNAAAGVAVARALGVSTEDALARISRAELSPHRSRLIDLGDVTVLDDSYNANPASVGAALRSLAEMATDGRRIAVLGDMAELGAEEIAMHRVVLEEAEVLGIDQIHTVGSRMTRAAAEASLTRHRAHGDLDALVAELLDDRRPGDVLLVKASRSVGLDRVVDGLRGAVTDEGSNTERRNGEAA